MQKSPDLTFIGLWLLFCAGMVYLMIVVGGITRLTQSGLSMVEWAPIMGILPPMSEAAWLEVFNKYKLYPEYLQINDGMNLEEFKSIFWWEYGHRVLGRVIGFFYIIPLCVFLYKNMIPRRWRLPLIGLFLLGGLQGLIGWYMVKSGLVDVPHVSQYRLVIHFGLALVILACMFWFALDFLRAEHYQRSASVSYLRATAMMVSIVFLMMISGIM